MENLDQMEWLTQAFKEAENVDPNFDPENEDFVVEGEMGERLRKMEETRRKFMADKTRHICASGKHSRWV